MYFVFWLPKTKIVKKANNTKGFIVTVTKNKYYIIR